MRLPPTSLADLLERDFQTKHVIPAAELLGYTHYHTHRSEKSPSGFPDLVLAGRRLVFVELKREKTNPTDRQQHWLRLLHKACAEVYLIRPRNLDDLVTVLAAPTWSELQWEGKVGAAHRRLLEELRPYLEPVSEAA